MKFEVVKTRRQMWDNPDDLLRGCMPRFCVVAVRESNVTGERESQWYHYLGTKEIRGKSDPLVDPPAFDLSMSNTLDLVVTHEGKDYHYTLKCDEWCDEYFVTIKQTDPVKFNSSEGMLSIDVMIKVAWPRSLHWDYRFVTSNNAKLRKWFTFEQLTEAADTQFKMVLDAVAFLGYTKEPYNIHYIPEKLDFVIPFDTIAEYRMTVGDNAYRITQFLSRKDGTITHDIRTINLETGEDMGPAESQVMLSASYNYTFTNPGRRNVGTVVDVKHAQKNIGFFGNQRQNKRNVYGSQLKTRIRSK